MLVLFASERTGHKPCALRLQDLDRTVVLGYLDHLERGRGNCVHTRNARLTAVRSFFHHVAANEPAALGIAHRILAIPTKRANTALCPIYLAVNSTCSSMRRISVPLAVVVIEHCCFFSHAPAHAFLKLSMSNHVI
jgi:hypothetical protein